MTSPLLSQSFGDREIEDLIKRMSLEDKLAQMSQSTAMRTPISDEIREQIRAGRWGSFLNAGSPADRQEAQRIALNESKLRIPLVFGRDVIHGYKTVFPIPLGQSASWNPELIERAASVAAREARAEGIHWTFAPMLDITRDPRWGRVSETLGEDPYLTSRLGTAMIRGFQGQSLTGRDRLAACAKHFAGYGAAEAGRDYNTTYIPDILLHDVFLPPFHAAVQAGVATVMTAFNAVNGVPASGNDRLVDGILRNGWKFNGVVVSDYESVTEMIKHGFSEDPKAAAAQAVLAGVDMEMVSTSYFDTLTQSVKQGIVPMKDIDEAVRRILRFKKDLGLFADKQPNYTNATVTPEALEVAKQIAVQSLVLLKNDNNVLPISTSVQKVAVIGPLADSPVDQMGAWVMDASPDTVRTPLQALRQRLGQDRVLYARALENSRDQRRDQFDEAKRTAAAADIVLAFLGEEMILSGEARSRAFLDLPGAQVELMQALAQTGKPVIAVILAGRPLTFPEVARDAEAILYAWHPGTMGGPAIVDVLFGDENPSGKLTITFPRTVGQVPIYYRALNTGRPPSPEDLGIPLGDPVDPKGYVSKYLDVDFTPAYPFGFGLSYTTFEYSSLKVSAPKVARTGEITVSADIQNTGQRAGHEVVQLYVRDLVASSARPVRELKGFQRLTLKPGERQSVSFKLPVSDLAFLNADGQRVVEPGLFHVWIASNAAGGLQGEFRVE